MSALTEFGNTRNTVTDQMEKAREDQVENNAGGFVFDIGPWEHFRRFLILGTEGGTFYANQRDHTLQAVDSLKEVAKLDGRKAVDLVVEISRDGRAPKNDQAIFSLAYLASVDDDVTRAYALNKLNVVCRTGMHLFQFADYVQKFRGWGRGLRHAIGSWYESKEADKLAYQVTKYRQRNGWSHRDLLRLAHPDGTDSRHKSLYNWVVGGYSEEDMLHPNDIGQEPIVASFNRLQKATSAADVAGVVSEGNVSHDMIPTEFKGNVEVWRALLENNMPITALLRNLGNMSKHGVFEIGSEYEKLAVSALTDKKRLIKGRVHPITVLNAYNIFKSGGGFRSSSTWTASPRIIEALDEAFYLAFDSVESSGKRISLNLDVSGSMGFSSPVLPGMTARDASAAMALVTINTEPYVDVRGFTGGTRWGGGRHESNSENLTDLSITKKDSIQGAVEKVSNLPFGPTDCALPMVHAKEKGLKYDTFVIYTDNETWAGGIQPFEALRQYRDSSGIDARLIVVAMTATGFSIADPTDAGMLDVVGFDTSTPDVISSFSRGDI